MCEIFDIDKNIDRNIQKIRRIVSQILWHDKNVSEILKRYFQAMIMTINIPLQKVYYKFIIFNQFFRKQKWIKSINIPSQFNLIILRIFLKLEVSHSQEVDPCIGQLCVLPKNAICQDERSKSTKIFKRLKKIINLLTFVLLNKVLNKILKLCEFNKLHK